jgi:hypothetical protein
LACDAGDKGDFWFHNVHLSVPSIGVFKAHDVVFAQVTAGLDLDHLQISFTGILKAVLDAQGDVGALVFSEQDFFVTPGNQGCAFDHDSVLGAVVVHLQAELGAGAHGDALDLKALAAVNAVIPTPRAVHLAVQAGLRVSPSL